MTFRMLGLAFVIFVPLASASAQEVPLKAPPAEAERVVVPSLGRDLPLDGYLFRPEGDAEAKRPAVVMLHGCSGLFNSKTGRFFPLYRPWARALTRAGYVVLVLDSASPRGLGQTCSGPNAGVMWSERPRDAYAALAFLQAQPSVTPDRIALMGWSQGGGAALIAINARTAGRILPESQAILAKLPADFRAAVAFYPGACSEAAQARTYPPHETVGWTSQVPLFVLFGDADVWTELAPCQTFLEAATARGNAVTLQVYPGAYHAFDAPGLKRTELPQYKTRDGRIPVVETNEAARADAFVRVLDWLQARMKSDRP